MNVLSLFDGISCAKVALERAGLPIKTYFASEIDTHAIAVSQRNHPEIVRLGDVRSITCMNLPPIDLLIGGSPCQDLSIAKKDRKGLEGDRSCLFWEYVRLWKMLRPKWFVLENVASMPTADRQTITEALGVEPVLFNASLVSAQSRKRLFWTNIKFDLPADRGILLKDILQPDGEVDPSMIVNGKAFCVTASYSKVGDGQTEYEHNKAKGQTMVKIGHLGTDAQANRVYDPAGKSVTLSANGGGLGAKTGLYVIGHAGTDDAQANRVYDASGKSACLTANSNGQGGQTGVYQIEGIAKSVVLNDHPLQVLKEGRTELGKQSRREIKQQTGKDSSARSSGHKAYFGRDGTKANCLTTHLGAEGLIVKETVIRKLTPIECERLQGLPDEYTAGIAKTHRYKCLGNAFNVDVVCHILAPLREHICVSSTDQPQHDPNASIA